MNLVTALFLVILLASSSYAAGRLHAQIGYRLGFRTGYRQGFGDGDRAAWLYRRREAAFRNTGPVLTPGGLTANVVPPVMTVAAPSQPGSSAPQSSVRPEPQPVVRAAAQATPPARAQLTAAPARPQLGPPERLLNVRPTNRGVAMRGTMYHSTGALAIRGGRHAHPE